MEGVVIFHLHRDSTSTFANFVLSCLHIAPQLIRHNITPVIDSSGEITELCLKSHQDTLPGDEILDLATIMRYIPSYPDAMSVSAILYFFRSSRLKYPHSYWFNGKRSVKVLKISFPTHGRLKIKRIPTLALADKRMFLTTMVQYSRTQCTSWEMLKSYVLDFICEHTPINEDRKVS